MEWLNRVVVFLGGAAIGSFLNVCIARIPVGMSVVTPGSHCPGCQHAISWYDNLPVLSYLLLRRRCRHCRTVISMVYPTVELVTAVLAVLLMARFELGAAFVAYSVFAASMVVITFIDIKHQIIPDIISRPGIAVGFGVSFFSPVTTPFSSLAGILAGGGFLAVVAAISRWWYRKEAMGRGDVKLLAMIGAFLGWEYLPLTVMVGSLTGSLFGVAAMLYTGADRKLPIPFGPFLAFGAVISLLWGDALIAWYWGYS